MAFCKSLAIALLLAAGASALTFRPNVPEAEPLRARPCLGFQKFNRKGMPLPETAFPDNNGQCGGSSSSNLLQLSVPEEDDDFKEPEWDAEAHGKDNFDESQSVPEEDHDFEEPEWDAEAHGKDNFDESLSVPEEDHDFEEPEWDAEAHGKDDFEEEPDFPKPDFNKPKPDWLTKGNTKKPVSKTAAGWPEDDDVAETTPAPSMPSMPSMWTTDDLDLTGDPHTDFYNYAVGGWKKKNPLPVGESSWGSFSVLNELNQARMKAIVLGLKAGADKHKEGSDEQKIADYYTAAYNEQAINKAGISKLLPLLEQLTVENVKSDITAVFGTMSADYGVGNVFAVGVNADAKDAGWQLLAVGQAGLGLPDLDYYTDDDKAKIREKYQQYIKSVFDHLKEDTEGDMDTKAEAENVFQFEKELSKVHMTREQMRDPKATYNKMSVAALQEKCAGGVMNWEQYFEKLSGKSVKEIGDIDVSTVQPIVDTNLLLKKILATRPETIVSYLKWRSINSFASFHLPKKYVDASFDFYGKVLSGVTVMKARWKRALGSTEGAFGDALGRIYVEKFFGGDTKKEALDFVGRIRAELRLSLETVEWMSNATRAKALEKVDKFNVKIGYPDKWEDYSKVHIKADDDLGNVLAVRKFDLDYMLSFVNKATDRSEWGMSPQTINAYYDPSMNEIVFPAGILQPPFYSKDADDALNFGGIGAVVGHEMTHGFDDQGSQYDASGTLNNWWTPEDLAQFKRRAQVCVDQSNAFEIDGVFLNGELTNGENLADNGGIKLSYAAFHRKMKEQKQDVDAKGANGFTPKQMFFFGFAKNWANNAKKESVLLQMETDPHSPSEWRANGPPSNVPEFYEAFHIVEADKMFRPVCDRVAIWAPNDPNCVQQSHAGRSHSWGWALLGCLVVSVSGW